MHDALIWLPEAADADTDAGIAPFLAPGDHTIWAASATGGFVALITLAVLALL